MFHGQFERSLEETFLQNRKSGHSEFMVKGKRRFEVKAFKNVGRRGNSMHIVTTIYYAEVRDSNQDVRKAGQLEMNDLKDTERQWLSNYEGKNRVEPIDGDR